MSLQIDNSYSYSKHNNCPKCGVPLNIRVVFHNVPDNCKEHITYPYMEIGQSMHMECYIQHVIDTILMSRLQTTPTEKEFNEQTTNQRHDLCLLPRMLRTKPMQDTNNQKLFYC